MSQHPTYRTMAKIEGWLHFTDFEILKTLCTHQNDTGGAIVEIGVHHGKSLIPLAAFSDERPLYVIDIFDDQEQNIDHSGLGDQAQLLENMRLFDIDRARATIDPRASADVSAQDIKTAVGPVSLFHIDGGHHIDAVQNDISLALAVLSPDGVIAIDDVFRPEWPEVTRGVFSHEKLNSEFVPFAIGFNKTYFCARRHYKKYQMVLLKNADLQHYLSRVYMGKSERTLVFQSYPLPEWRFQRVYRWLQSLFFPERFIRSRSSKTKPG